MGQIIEWGDVDSGMKKGGGKGGSSNSFDKFLKLSPGQTYKVRPVGNPCTFHSYYVASTDDPKRFNRAITADPANCIIRQKYNLEPKTRYAVNVIDRADGKLKVMEAPPSVFDKIKAWAKAAGQDPGAKGGADFEIRVVVPPSGDRKRTEYPTTPIIQTPFTEEEKAMLKQQGLFDLEEIYKETPQSEIEAKLYGPSKTVATAQSTTQTASVNIPVKKLSNDTDNLGF